MIKKVEENSESVIQKSINQSITDQNTMEHDLAGQTRINQNRIIQNKIKQNMMNKVIEDQLPENLNALAESDYRDIEEQIRIITKGAAEVISVEELREKLIKAQKEKRPLIVKLGLDPTAPDIHLGHTVVLRKIRQMQELGHHAVIIIGDFTGKIGDPTGKSKTRVPLSEEQVHLNAMTYTNQIFKIIDSDKTTVRFNSEWLSKLNFEEVIKLASSITVARLLERDDFQNRFRHNEPIGLHEFFYPLMQAYDSVEINADIELGGSDQTFNILMGRNLQGSLGKERQIALFMPILEGLDGVQKMSKSLGNYIGVHEPAQVMFKKVMEIPDSLIIRYYELVTDEHPDRIAEIKEQLEKGRNPRDCKLELARIITGLYHGSDDTIKAEEYFQTVFQKGELPKNMPEIAVPSHIGSLLDLIPMLTEKHFIPSGSEFRRLVKQGGVQINREKVMDLAILLPEKEFVLRIGKKKFVKVVRSKENE